MYIPEEEVRSLLTYDALIPAIREALIDYSTGKDEKSKVVQPPRSILRPSDKDWFAVMPVIHGEVMGVKSVTFFPGNANHGLHTHMAVITLFSRTTGEPLAVMDGRLITAMRTAAVSAVALDALADPGVTSLGILGAGVQAHSHLETLRSVRPSLTDIRIWSRTSANAEQLAAENGARATTLEEAAGSDIVLTATASPTPVLEGHWLSPKAVILAVGAVGAHLRELDDEAARSCWVVAESRQGVERESGDILLSGARVQAEIGEILANPAYPVPRGSRILFKSVGMAIEDLVAARLVWQAHSASQT
ncbi:ornithine cyclodeaminase family protein [Terracidiphilus gabretensis]|uniref:ornithine cyclodeaminase family protein n=1 Tax=Terracidiphilus gabretensis TaxID=1577687 RepID=UPI00071C075B|nr:ornithine cyclodeaminase family protein [Terracidiphilus gabretensis]